MTAICFPAPTETPIKNALDGRPYALRRADALEPTAARLEQIAAVCNEPDPYGWLFKETLGGRAYTAEDAAGWLTWAAAGWRDNTHFVFAALDAQGQVAAACDIKSNDPSWAEIGYWSSRRHRGVMTNIVLEVSRQARQAGFTTLFARTRRGNTRSVGVLHRAGFIADGDRSAADDAYDWFTLSMEE